MAKVKALMLDIELKDDTLKKNYSNKETKHLNNIAIDVKDT